MLSFLGRLTLTMLLGFATMTGCADSQEADDGRETATQAESEATASDESTASDDVTEADNAALDGMTFSAMTNEKGKSEMAPDTLMFTDGMFESIACREWGFSAAEYSSETDGYETTFTSTTTSEEEGTLTWTGTVSGKNITGSYVWEKDGQDPIEYEFTGVQM